MTGVLHVCNWDILYTCLLFPFRMRCCSAIHVIGAFTWNAAIRRFQECQKVRCLYCLASLFSPLCCQFKAFSSQKAVWGCHSAHREAAVAY